MNISFEYYRIFYVVAKYGNITKAADELMISQPAISKCIKHLEEQLGGQLFIRTKRGVILTDEAKEFYKNVNIDLNIVPGEEVHLPYTNLHIVNFRLFVFRHIQ